MVALCGHISSVFFAIDAVARRLHPLSPWSRKPAWKPFRGGCAILSPPGDKYKVVADITFTHRHNLVRGHATGANNLGVEVNTPLYVVFNSLNSRKSYTPRASNKSEIRNQRLGSPMAAGGGGQHGASRLTHTQATLSKPGQHLSALPQL